MRLYQAYGILKITDKFIGKKSKKVIFLRLEKGLKKKALKPQKMALTKKTPQNGFKPLKKALKPITGLEWSGMILVWNGLEFGLSENAKKIVGELVYMIKDII